MKRAISLAGAAVAALALSACGSGSLSGGESTESGGAGGAAEGDLTKVAVGVIPIVDTAPIWLGKEQGFFEDAGLDLDIQTTTGGAAAVPGVVSGDFQFAFGNTMSVMVANDKGLDVRYVANGNSTTGDTSSDFGAVVVPADSEIQAPADLAGRTVSVNNLSNIGDTTIRKVVEDDGGDESAIRFVEIPFPDAPAALESGQVDAAWIVEPFLTQAVESGARVISYNFAETDPNLDISGYFTSAEYIEANPELVENFTEAMNKSLVYAQENPEAVRDVVGTYTKIDEAMRAKMILPTFRVEFDRDAAAVLGDAATRYGTLTEAPDLDLMLPAQQ
ncbi:ABC transporter substrate-binding protein [Arthrobacter sp. zg-Y820]|uniref:ABC transporter substrate-binding protein n=1 Tax=unclassified Arthrobacter TaxID=235627 RepID=UPI001E524555|nr:MULTISPECIES: ABC transporter substrate-binding protein [unclassified Arthrobacter]MCC9196132.1 ABC transporter substrate-binding protein [Arthrobacter sp. zg-Y820]MDK1278991.1 ABC transporter substrate-binding protein [Arthrobacter sp. zg.Y820]WIB08596.1 ABC transporter substrate-binding protein [Arthrobacter sp. zg-Y820]